MNIRRIFTALGILLALTAGTWWTMASSTAATPAPLPIGVPGLPIDDDGQTLLVSWSVDTQARFEPCGCVAGMHGGLLRRSPLLRRVPHDRLLAVEVAGWAGGAEVHQLARTRAYRQGLMDAGVAVVGLGQREVVLTAATLDTLLATNGPPAVSANVRLDSRHLVPWVPIDRAGQRFAVTSVAPRGSAVGNGVTILPPEEALAHLDTADRALVVLADLDESGLRDLALAVPRITLLIGGAVTSPSPEPVRVGATTIIHAANHGKTVGWWAWGAATCGFELLADVLPEDPGQRALLTQYQQGLADLPQPMDVLDPVTSYVGDTACATCHPAAAQVHGASRHAHALEALAPKGYLHDPDCLQCHVTGLDRPGGWRRHPTRQHFGRVGCESCHGPGAAHVGNPTLPLRPVSAATCVTCHDAENSPRFDYPSYWARIRH